MTSPMDRKLSILLCLSMALTLAGCAAEEEAPLMDPTVTVEVAEVQSGSLSNDGTYIGTISAEGTASVIPLVSGTVEEIAVSVGDTVNAGDLLCRFDNESARIALESAQAAYQSALTGVSSAEAAVSSAQESYQSALAGYGGTGDGSRLTFAERCRTAELTIAQTRAAGRRTIVHVGQTLQRHALELAEHAMTLGADAVASVPPQGGWSETVAYYTALAAQAPVFIYYIPGLTHVSADYDQLRQLLDLPGVAGIKVSDWNIFLIRRIKADYPEKIVYTGLDEMVVPGLLYGADGSIGTWINLLPEFYCKLWTLAQAGRCTELNRLQTAYTEFLRKGWQFGILNAFQELMRSLGYAEKCFRAPAVWQPGSMPEPLLQELLADLDGLNALAASMS